MAGLLRLDGLHARTFGRTIVTDARNSGPVRGLIKILI